MDGNTGTAPYYDQICVGGAEPEQNEEVEESDGDSELLGSYINTYYVGDSAYYPDYVNDWHFVEITYDNTNYLWNNEAGYSWTLNYDGSSLSTNDDCPYGA